MTEQVTQERETMDRESLTFKQFMHWLVGRPEFVSGGLRRNGGVKVTLDGDDRYKFDTLGAAAEEIAKALGVDPPWEQPAAPPAEEDEWPVCPSCKGTGEEGGFCDGGPEPDCSTCQGKGYIAEQEASPVADREPGIGDRVVYYDGDEAVDRGTVICEQEDNPSRWVLSTGVTPLKSDCRLASPHPPVADPPDALVGETRESIDSLCREYEDLRREYEGMRYTFNPQKLGADYHEVAGKLAAAEAQVAELEARCDELAQERDNAAWGCEQGANQLRAARSEIGRLGARLNKPRARYEGMMRDRNFWVRETQKEQAKVADLEARLEGERRAIVEQAIAGLLREAMIEEKRRVLAVLRRMTSPDASEAIRALAGADAPEVLVGETRESIDSLCAMHRMEGSYEGRGIGLAEGAALAEAQGNIGLAQALRAMAAQDCPTVIIPGPGETILRGDDAVRGKAVLEGDVECYRNSADESVWYSGDPDDSETEVKAETPRAAIDAALKAHEEADRD